MSTHTTGNGPTSLPPTENEHTTVVPAVRVKRDTAHAVVKRASWAQAETMPTDAVRPDTDPTVPLLVNVMSRKQRFVFQVLVALWLLAQVGFWGWWFNPEHIAGPVEYLITTLLLAYFLLIPGYFLLLASQMKRPNPRLALPTHLRVALATSFVPGSESLEVLERTLRAMKAQQGMQADVWVLDEGDVVEVRDLAERLGVYHFSRKHMPQYQQPDWPFKAKYKAGNYNAWLDAIGYSGYDVLVQMDTDHAPSPTYLQEILRPFSYPGVAYVAAPSDVSGNRKQSWLVMARAILDAPLHGPMQMGFNSRLCPIIIGSHSAVRVPALQHIGGFQQTRAEDHHNTLRLARFGYHGVFAPDALAVGDGPTSLGDALSQEFQWARSITVVMLRFFRRDTYGMPFWRWLEFVFCETWYSLYAGTFALGFVIPIVALLTNQPWARVGFVDFLVHYELIDVALILMLLWVRSQGWLRPRDCPIISWRSMLLVLGRWPVMLLAVGDAILATITRRDFKFGVTFKGNGPGRPLQWQTLLPQFVIVLASVGVVVWYNQSSLPYRTAAGYTLLALINAATYALYIIAVVLLHWWETRRAGAKATWRGITSKLAAGLAVACLTLVIVVNVLPQYASLGASASPLITGWADSAAPVRTQSPIVPTVEDRPAVVPAPQKPFQGAYDPSGRLDDIPNVQVNHYFVNWIQDIGPDIITDVRASQRQGRFPMFTIEPWANVQQDRTPMLADVIAGRYEPQEREIAEALQAVAPQVVYIRFMHEMDLVGPYPWETTNTQQFIKAYRQFVTYLRQAGVKNAKFIWSPAHLNTPELDYYPGSDVVDMVGISMYISPTNSATSITDFLANVMPFATQLGKPLIVCEWGLRSQNMAAMLAMAQEAHQIYAHTPGLMGLVYYNWSLAPVWNPQLIANATWVLPDNVARMLFTGTEKVDP